MVSIVKKLIDLIENYRYCHIYHLYSLIIQLIYSNRDDFHNKDIIEHIYYLTNKYIYVPHPRLRDCYNILTILGCCNVLDNKICAAYHNDIDFTYLLRKRCEYIPSFKTLKVLKDKLDLNAKEKYLMLHLSAMRIQKQCSFF